MIDTMPPRLLSRAGLRAYMGGLAWSDIALRMATGRLPAPMWGLSPDDSKARWDRRAVDRALDAASGLPATVEQDIDLLDRHLGTR